MADCEIEEEKKREIERGRERVKRRENELEKAARKSGG
jgi:hypothetical protein